MYPGQFVIIRSRIDSFLVGSFISWLKLKVFIKFTSSNFISLFLWFVPQESHLWLKSPNKTNVLFYILSRSSSKVEYKLSKKKERSPAVWFGGR